MKKLPVLLALAYVALALATPVYAQAADVTKVQTFIKGIITVLVTLAGLVSAGFFVWGGITYITSTGNPESMDRSKKTIVNSAIGLAVVLGAYVLSNIVTQLAAGAFGAPAAP